MRSLCSLLLVLLPTSMRRVVATRLLGWDVHPTARIGRSLIRVGRVSLGERASIGSFNVISGLDELVLKDHASIATRNSITAHPLASVVFDNPRRRSALVLRRHAKITVAHEIDCSDLVELEPHARLAGFRCQVLTHSLNLVNNRQTTGPVVLGEQCAVMSGSLLLSGTRVPARSVVSAGSVVTTRLTKEYTFYRGNPAEAVRELPEHLAYFHRGEEEADQLF